MHHLSTPWFAENIPSGFVVRDAERKPVAYVYGQDGVRQTGGAPRPMTIDEAREMALAIAKLPEVLMRKNKGSQDRLHPPLSAGKVAKRSRTDATLSPHSKSAHPPIPILNGRAKAKRPDRALTANQMGV